MLRLLGMGLGFRGFWFRGFGALGLIPFHASGSYKHPYTIPAFMTFPKFMMENFCHGSSDSDGKNVERILKSRRLKAWARTTSGRTCVSCPRKEARV